MLHLKMWRFIFYLTSISALLEAARNNIKSARTIIHTNFFLTPTETVNETELNFFENTTEDVANDKRIYVFEAYDDITKADTTKVKYITPTNTENSVETTRAWIPIRKRKGNETKLNRNKSTENNETINSCPNYKYIDAKLDLDSMVDVWQTMYYKLPEKVQCFRIYIKKLTKEEKQECKDVYGTFDGTVDWDRCNLEIKSATAIGRHFLQGDSSNDGVLDNIIIMYGNGDENKDQNELYNLKDEFPDQWQVHQNLLLLRDCEKGGILVFSKVPHQPGREELEDALKIFGSEAMGGESACKSNEEVNRGIDEEDF